VIVNRIVTRGLGPSRGIPGRAGLITQGYGGPSRFVKEAFRRSQIRLGQSGTKRRLQEFEEIIVWAKLIEINHKKPQKEVKGWIRVNVSKHWNRAAVMAEHVSSRVRAAWEVIKVTIKRVK